MILFIILSIFDAFAVISLMFVLYRFPYKEYLLEISLMSVWSAITSYLVREVVGIEGIDPLVQMLLIVLFFRFVLKVKFLYSSLITLSGFVAYILLQSLLIFAYTAAGVVTSEETAQSSSGGAMIIQISSIVSAMVIFSIFKYFKLGFQFISRPPHDFNVRERNVLFNRYFWVSIGLALIVVSASTALLLHMKPLFIIPLCLASILVFYYLSHRREVLDRDRIVIPKDRINYKTMGQ